MDKHTCYAIHDRQTKELRGHFYPARLQLVISNSNLELEYANPYREGGLNMEFIYTWRNITYMLQYVHRGNSLIVCYVHFTGSVVLRNSVVTLTEV